MGAHRRFRWIALFVVALLGVGPLFAGSAAETLDPIILEPGGGRIMSLTGVLDPHRITGMPTGMSQQSGARFEPLRENCLIQPPEMDLRLIWMEQTDDGHEVTLRFFAPFRFVEELYGQPVKHTLTLIFLPPSGDSVTVSVGKSERVSIKRGKENLDTEGVGFSTYFTDLVFDLPASIGIGPDWVLTTRSRIVAEADYCPDPNFPNRYFEANTTPVRVSALTGEGEEGIVRALPQAMAYESVFHKEYKAIEWKTHPMPAGTRLESLHLEQVEGHLIAVMTMDAPFAFPTNEDGSLSVSAMTVGLDLVAPGYLGLKHPFSVRFDLYGPGGSGPVSAVVTAPVLKSLGSSEAIGTVPVAMSGKEVRIDLSALTPIESDYEPPPLPSGEGFIQELGATALTIEGTISFEDEEGGDESEPVTIEVVGPAIRFTFADGTTSTGWIDPYDNQFIADGEVIAGGLGVDDTDDACANAEAVAESFDPEVFTSMGLAADISALQNMKDLHGDDPAWQDELKKDEADLIRRLYEWVKGEKPKKVAATGCHGSAQPTAVGITSTRALFAQEESLAKPDWLAPLPELYWDLNPIGIQPISFGKEAPAPFPFPSSTEWIPASWGLAPDANGWGMRAWSQVWVPGSDGSGAIAPTVLTPYVAASLLIATTGEEHATPVAIRLPGEAVIASSLQAKRRVRQGYGRRERSN